MDKFSFLESSSMINDKFSDLFEGPARKPEMEITQREMDIARSIQVFTEEAILKMAKFIKNNEIDRNRPKMSKLTKNIEIDPNLTKWRN